MLLIISYLLWRLSRFIMKSPVAHKQLQVFEHLRTRPILLGLGLAFVLSACGSAAPTSSAESVISDVETAVAATVTAQATIPPTSTATVLPTASPTLTTIPTQITATPTTQVWYSSSDTTYYYTCADAEYIKDMTIADGTVLMPGETFTKTWKLKNTGNCTWTSDFAIVFISGDDMDGSDTETDQTVYVNKKAEISVELTAPDEEGTYYGYWQLADEYGYTFGDTVHVEIVVDESATSTPTATASPTATFTSTPTPVYSTTPTVTSTSMPTTIPTTATNTAVPTSTQAPTSTEILSPRDTPTPIPTSTSLPTDIPTATAAS